MAVTSKPDTDLSAKLDQLQARQADYQDKLKTLRASGEKQLSVVDPDARRLKKHGQNVTGYNVQVSVDSKHKLLVAGEATSDGNDSNRRPAGVGARSPQSQPKPKTAHRPSNARRCDGRSA